ncbi:MAG: NAD-dependent epimerase/dehydratase family protein [Pseudomonadota bacterium]
MTTNKTVCVAGASGLVGANLTKKALSLGYNVNGTLTDSTDTTKTKHLLALPGARERLTLLSADMSDPGAFDTAVRDTEAVFIACLIPTYFGPTGKPAREMDDEEGERDIVMPTVNGCLNIMQSAANAGVNDVLICSSTSSTNPKVPVEHKNEVDHWSDRAHQYEQKKYTSAAKTVMEAAAIKFADANNLRLCIFLPTLMLGPAVLPQHARTGFQGMLNKMIQGEPSRYDRIPNDSSSMIHTEDLANLFFAALADKEAQGRYFGVYDSWPMQDIFDQVQRLLPDAHMPSPLQEPPLPPTSFDFTRRDSLGVHLRDIPTILEQTVNSMR